jgi:hypothetical protein
MAGQFRQNSRWNSSLSMRLSITSNMWYHLLGRRYGLLFFLVAFPFCAIRAARSPHPWPISGWAFLISPTPWLFSCRRSAT